jgi:hypothetical protein
MPLNQTIIHSAAQSSGILHSSHTCDWRKPPFHAHEVLHATLSPPTSQTALASAALEEELNRSHQEFIGREVQHALEALHPLEASQILDRVVHQTVNARVHAREVE